MSLARPGGNTTGIAIWGDEAAQKQLEMLKEAVPQIRKVGVLRLRSSAHDRRFARLENTAARLGLGLMGAEIATAGDLPSQFAHLISWGVEAFVVLANPSLDDWDVEEPDPIGRADTNVFDRRRLLHGK